MAKQYYEFDTEENKITANVTDKVKGKVDEAGGIDEAGSRRGEEARKCSLLSQ